VPQFTGAKAALQVLIDRYPDYQSFLRPDATLHIVVVADDDSEMTSDAFQTARAALIDPGMPSDYRFHAICSEAVTFVQIPPLPPITGPCRGGLGSDAAAADIGTVYLELVEAQNGVFRSICTTDWNPVFEALAEAVNIGAPLPCQFGIPAAPEGQELDPNKVNFVFTSSSGTKTTVPRVDGKPACAGPGWYYDDPDSPSEIFACPATCNDLEDDPSGEVEISFGCATFVP
jgi:hypothetical protein